MRRIILEEPWAESAIWSRRLAVFAILLALIGVILLRGRFVEVNAGIAIFAAAIVIDCIALLLAAAGAVVIWRTGRRGVGHLVSAVFLCLLLLAYPAWLAAQAVRLPVLNDISTDVNDPPAFNHTPKAVAARNGFKPRPAPADRKLDQQRAYPDIQPIVIDVEAEEGYRLVLAAVRNLGWRIVDRKAPVTRKVIPAQRARRERIGRTRRTRLVPARPEKIVEASPGHIEAVTRTMIMGFPDDITIRIRPQEAQTRIDVRSASRFGRHDFGANAARIRRFASELQTQLDAR